MTANKGRPGCIVHWRDAQEPDASRYPGSDELPVGPIACATNAERNRGGDDAMPI